MNLVSSNFLNMGETPKKSDAGAVIVWMLFAGESKVISNDLSASIVDYCFQIIDQNSV